MQTEYPHRKFYRLDAVRDELSPQAAECFDSLALFDQLRLEGATEATALKAAGCSRRCPAGGSGACAFRCGGAPRSAPCWRASTTSRPAPPPPGA